MPNVLTDIDLRMPLIIITIIVIILFLAYSLLLGCSFLFMNIFSSECNKKVEFLNLTIFQKCEAINMTCEKLRPYIKESDPLFVFSQNQDYKKYHFLTVEEIEEFYFYTEKMIMEIQKIYINNELNENKIIVEDFLRSIEDMNEKYYQASQLYNTKVIGYNYWRNFFSTKWLKKLLHINEKQTMK